MHASVYLLSVLLAQPAEPEAELAPPPRLIQYWPKELVPTLVVALKDPDLDVQQYARAALINLGPQAIPGLLQGLRSPNAELRRLCATLLGDIGGEEGMPSLIQSLQDPDTEVRRAAAYAISQIVRR